MEKLTAFAKTNTAARLRAAAARGALSHALIFSGSGDRESAARYAACAYECTAAQKPCLACAHCRKVIAGIHPDVSVVRDDEHAEIAVDIIRAARTDAFVRPNEGARKVYIFPDCSVLNDKGQNILLKTVEEGPPYASFIFCAENISSLLQTIRSRCVEYKLQPLAQSAEADMTQAMELVRVIAAGTAASRTAFFTALERDKVTREALAVLLEQARSILASALLSLYGGEVAAEVRKCAENVTSRLTKSQILGTIELLETYHNHCNYNVGVGATLGGLAAELEEVL